MTSAFWIVAKLTTKYPLNHSSGKYLPLSCVHSILWNVHLTLSVCACIEWAFVTCFVYGCVRWLGKRLTVEFDLLCTLCRHSFLRLSLFYPCLQVATVRRSSVSRSLEAQTVSHDLTRGKSIVSRTQLHSGSSLMTQFTACCHWQTKH